MLKPGGIGKTVENLEEAIGGETHEVEEMYPAFHAVAVLQEEQAAARSDTRAWEAEKIHADLYRQAKAERPTLSAPPANGATLLAERRGVCHGLDRVSSARKEREGWAATIAHMVSRGAELDNAEQAVLLDHLVQVYGP